MLVISFILFAITSLGWVTWRETRADRGYINRLSKYDEQREERITAWREANDYEHNSMWDTVHRDDE